MIMLQYSKMKLYVSRRSRNGVPQEDCPPLKIDVQEIVPVSSLPRPRKKQVTVVNFKYTECSRPLIYVNLSNVLHVQSD